MLASNRKQQAEGKMQARKYNLRSYPGFIQLTVCLLILYLPPIVVGVIALMPRPQSCCGKGFLACCGYFLWDWKAKNSNYST